MNLDWPAPVREPSAPPTDAGILAEIAAGLSTGRDLGELLQRFLLPVVRLAGAQGGAVRTLAAQGEQMHLISEIGLSDEMCRAERTVDRHCGFCGTAANEARVVWAADLSSCRARSASDLQGARQGQRMLAVPLQHRGRVLGVYNLFFAGRKEPSAQVMQLLRAVGELLGMAMENARLEAENLNARILQERQLMAAEVHDSLAQSLSFVKMRLPLLQDAMRGHDDLRAERYFQDVRGALSQAHSSLRSILTHFRSPMDPQGLMHALDASARAFRACCGPELEFVNDLPDLTLTPEQEAHVFHIVQEALTNIARHASARHARLHIAAAPAGQVQVLVEDDGTGLPRQRECESTHYGMEIMQERARRVGGTLEVGAREGGGTRVRLAFPLPGAQAR